MSTSSHSQSKSNKAIGLGVDPGMRKCGLVLVERSAEGWRYIAGTTVTTPAKLPLHSRMLLIRQAYLRLILRHRTAIRWVAIEDPLHVITYHQERGTTDVNALRLLTVVGQAIEWALSLGATPVLVEPGDAKRGIGALGSADKVEVIRLARLVLYNCPDDIDSHCADAAAAAITGGRVFERAAIIDAAKEQRS